MFATGVAVHATGVYVTGGTPEVGGTYDLTFSRSGTFLGKYDSAGNQLWTREETFRQEPLGASGNVAVDDTGVYVLGSTAGILRGQCTAGASDVVLRKYDHTGKEMWARQSGTYNYDFPLGVSVAATGVYVAGITNAPKSGSAFLAKLDKAPAVVPDAQPRILSECIVNAASNIGGGVAPGEIVTLFGSSIGPPQLTTLRQERGLETTLADTRILFNGVPARLLSVSDKQSSAIVPYAVADRPLVLVDVQVEYKGVRSNIVSVPVLDAHPGIFTLDGSGRGQAVIWNEDDTLNSSSNPARPGSIVTMYATGSGLTDPPGIDGSVLDGVPRRPKLPVSVILANESYNEEGSFHRAEVLSAEENSVAGLLQIKVRLPLYLPAGNLIPHPVIGLDDYELGGAGPFSWVTRSFATMAVR